MSVVTEKYGSCIRIPVPMLQRADNLRRTLTSHSGGVPSRAEASRLVYEAGLKSLESGGVQHGKV